MNDENSLDLLGIGGLDATRYAKVNNRAKRTKHPPL
jgi:hypothetical protein